jgi:hypothetical protein
MRTRSDQAHFSQKEKPALEKNSTEPSRRSRAVARTSRRRFDAPRRRPIRPPSSLRTGAAKMTPGRSPISRIRTAVIAAIPPGSPPGGGGGGENTSARGRSGRTTTPSGATARRRAGIASRRHAYAGAATARGRFATGAFAVAARACSTEISCEYATSMYTINGERTKP